MITSRSISISRRKSSYDSPDNAERLRDCKSVQGAVPNKRVLVSFSLTSGDEPGLQWLVLLWRPCGEVSCLTAMCWLEGGSF